MTDVAGAKLIDGLLQPVLDALAGSLLSIDGVDAGEGPRPRRPRSHQAHQPWHPGLLVGTGRGREAPDPQARERRPHRRQAKGTRFGRKPKLTAHQQAEALKRLAAGESCRSIARTMAVHHATVARLAG